MSVVGRESARLVFTIVLARAVGPEAYGIAAQALVFIAVVGLLLDQGFSSALIQRSELDDGMVGAVVGLNLLVGVALAAISIAITPWWANFMSTPELRAVLPVLAVSLVVKAASVTPRALLIRRMAFKKIGVADVTAAVVGGASGVAAAVLGLGYWAVVVQNVATDLTLVVVLLLVGAGTRPNLRFRHLSSIAAFSGRAFGAGILSGAIARNIDNLLVGRFQGPTALAFYGLAYRLLLLPVQLVSSTIGSVLFPAFSRHADDVEWIKAELTRTTRLLAVGSFPAMALLAAAAVPVLDLLFGAQWLPAAPIVQVLALTGGVQAVYYSTSTPLILGLGRDRLNLWVTWLTTVLSTAGIVAGLPYGPFGVAVGYSVAALVLVPVEWLVRRHLIQQTLGSQAGAILPGAHMALWVAAGYMVTSHVVRTDSPVVTLLLGVPIATLVGIGALRVFHPGLFRELWRLARSVTRRRDWVEDAV